MDTSALTFGDGLVILVTSLGIFLFRFGFRLFIRGALALLFDFLNLAPVPPPVGRKLEIKSFRLRDSGVRESNLIFPRQCRQEIYGAETLRPYPTTVG